MKKQIINLCVTALISVGAVVEASASQPGSFDNARSLGMGGVSVAIADDYSAIYRNPAGIAMQKKNQLSVITPTFSRNSDFDEVTEHIDALSDADTPATRNSNFRHLGSIMGKTGYQGWSNTAYYMSEKGFAVSVRYDDWQMYSVENPTNPKIKSSVYKDTIVAGTYSGAFEDSEPHNIFRDKATGWWGANFKVTSRKMTETSYSARDFSALNSSLLRDTDKSGLAFDCDIGAVWQITNPIRPILGVFVGNLLESKFSDEAGRNNRLFSIGTSIKPLPGDEKRAEKLILACEYYDDGSHVNSFNKIRLGGRFELTNGCHLLFGVKSGYLTGGIDFSFKDVSFAVSTYGEELGARPGDREDRRYAVDASLRF